MSEELENNAGAANPLDEMEEELQDEEGEASEEELPEPPAGAHQEPVETFVPPAPETPEPPVVPTEAVPPAVETPAVPPVPQMAAAVPVREETERELGIVYDKMSSQMREALQAQPKVTFMIPKMPGEDESLAYESVQLNGYRIQIKKGTMVQIPQQVAEILAHKYQIEMTAGQNMRADRDERTADRLS